MGCYIYFYLEVESGKNKFNREYWKEMYYKMGVKLWECGFIRNKMKERKKESI